MRHVRGVRRDAYKILVGRFQWKKLLRRSRRRWEDNIKTDLQGVGWGGMDWIDLAQNKGRLGALVNALMNLWVLWNSGNFVTNLGPFSSSGRTLLRWDFSVCYFWRFLNPVRLPQPLFASPLGNFQIFIFSMFVHPSNIVPPPGVPLQQFRRHFVTPSQSWYYFQCLILRCSDKTRN